MQKYFFSQDQDCHWYMIPVEKRKRWQELMNGSGDDNDDAINTEFGDYRTGGGIGNIEFTVEPKKSETSSVYSRPECIFMYCNHPLTCKADNKCHNPQN
jgi:hypothetical protein